MELKHKTILITGGTGSLGQMLTSLLLDYDVETIRIFSRNESKQTEMKEKSKDKRVKFFLGDVRDKPRLLRAMENVDIVIHTAALKHVEAGEYNPFEFLNTNVIGSQNVIDCCLERDVKLCIAISSDKAFNPNSVYGATKLMMERLVFAANNYKGKHQARFSCVRLGNLFGSSGSVVNKFKAQEVLTVTDLEATRFSLTLEEAACYIIELIKKNVAGLFIPELKAYTLKDLVQVMGKAYSIIGLRPGEKLHEELSENLNSALAPKYTQDELREMLEWN